MAKRKVDEYGIESWIDDESGKYWVKDPALAKGKGHVTTEAAKAAYQVIKAKYQTKEPTQIAEQKRIKRIEAQDPSWVGTNQAVVDSSKMYKTMGEQFKPEHIKKTEKLKTVRTEIKKLKDEVVKLKTEVDAYDALSADNKALLMPEKVASFEAKKKQLELKNRRIENIKTRYPDYNIDDPINILD